MSNLTFDEQLVREHKAEPLEGHTVVVLERVGAEGERFHSLLEPGAERPRQGLVGFLRGKPSPYFAFAVDASRGRSLEFTEHVMMAERAHELDLQFSMWYHAGDPQVLVSTRTSDPLGRVRRKVAEVVSAEIAELSWVDVCQAFRAKSEMVVENTLSDLNRFARSYGITITELRLRPRFAPNAVKADRMIYHAQEKGRVASARIDVARELQTRRSHVRREHAEQDDMDRALTARRRYQDKMADAMTDKAVEFVSGAGSLHELQDVQAGLASRGTGMLIPGIQSHASLASGVTGSSPALAAGGDGLPSVLNDVVSLTHAFGDAQSRRIRAGLLHLVAALVADDSPQPTGEQLDLARRARNDLDAVSALPADQLQALHDLTDAGKLRKRLYP